MSVKNSHPWQNKTNMRKNVLNNIEMDKIPKHFFNKYILGKTSIDDKDKEEILSSRIIKKITDQQFEDGSWDRFHTLSSSSTTNITTENALRRLILLGLDINFEPIKNVFSYMEQYLQNKIDYRDGKGIYYISGRGKLTVLPNEFMS